MNCYILDPKAGHPIPDGLNKDNTLFYPESGMTRRELHTTGCPRDHHIITDAPELVGLYKREEVFFYRDGKLVNPDFQTYGASQVLIERRLWDRVNDLPRAVYDGKITNIMGYPVAPKEK